MSSKWKKVKLTDITQNLNYKRVPLSSVERLKKQGMYPYYGASGIVDYINDYIFDGRYLLISEDGENLRSRKTPIAFQAIGKFWVNNHAHILKEKEEGILDYLEYYFSILDLTPYITGAVQPKLNKRNLEDIDFFIPHKKIRLKINKILNSFTNKITLNNQINETLEAMAQALFKSWFIDFEPVKAKIEAKEAGQDAEGILLAAMSAISGKEIKALKVLQTTAPEEYAELKAIAEQFPDSLEESELGMIPKGWEVSTLGAQYQITMGQSPKGDTYNENNEGTLFFQGRAEFGWRYPTPRLFTTAPKRIAKAGNVLMSVRAPVGDFNIALNDCCIGRGLAALQHKSGSPTFTFYQMNSLRDVLNRYNGEGTVFGSINQSNLKAIKSVFPTRNLIDKFISKAQKLDDLIKNYSITNLALTELRDTLLPKLLSGKIDVSNVEIM